MTKRGKACGPPEECSAAFEYALSRIERHARIKFADVRCPQRKADFIAEAVGLSWKWWLVLWEKGKDPRKFVSALAGYAVKAARSGRRVVGRGEPCPSWAGFFCLAPGAGVATMGGSVETGGGDG